MSGVAVFDDVATRISGRLWGLRGTGSPAVAVMAIAATDTWVARPLTTA
ncbi:hypothetical protein I551_0324 [Mycobacterium ulcerans str. Harvey]|uniref:Uncharacterized protein n=1 Tax=Mycobacterium ulcerans str. Harvey TaxID=1299332 RepID=A0ABP3ARC6_MYCUL|nr:hypothetical protein I551_0324 [Mycobacterium ulcerans str. Harvey]